jgi:hypothetical protein
VSKLDPKSQYLQVVKVKLDSLGGPAAPRGRCRRSNAEGRPPPHPGAPAASPVTCATRRQERREVIVRLAPRGASSRSSAASE